VFFFVDQYRGDKAPQHERREQGRHPVESKKSARVVVYIYIFNREREREIVRRRQSSIVSIIFSFFEIIRSLSLSFFAFCCCRESERREAPSKKKKIFADVKKNHPKFSALFPRASSPISDHPPQFNYWNEDGGESVASKRRTRFFFAQKRRKKRSSFIFRRFFGTESEERRERRARAKSDKQTKKYQFNKKPTEK